ncbi:hypothetical protein [Micromonospora citrea]|uniref:hypothetical protein n=1 Tax=Micromonospora citrea TaxID=47855 RepID=UPI00114D0AE8|nr:hypothetical protein [Micromonospora citrea]
MSEKPSWLRLGRLFARSVVALSLVPVVAFSAVPASAAPPRGAGSHGEADNPIAHGVPRVPLTIDGESVSADEIVRYNGRALYLVALPEAGSPGRLAAFTEPADFERLVRARGGPRRALDRSAVDARRAPQSQLEAGAAASGYSYIYEGSQFAGHAGALPAGSGYSDLTKRDMSCTLWWCTSWNDQASSAAADNANGVTLYEHIKFEGSQLFIPGGYAALDLAYYGWDNRTSSWWSW